jgi:alkaline phosphatase D
LFSAGLFALYPLITHTQGAIFCSEIDAILKERNVRFPFGVASGDPRYTSVVLWTAVYTDRTDEITVDWELASDSLFTQPVSKGATLARHENGFSVKVLVENLFEARTYYYRFRFDDQYSPTGRTRTAANQANSLSFGVVSCSSYSCG